MGMSQKQIDATVQATGRVNIFEGSIRAGKTFSWLLIMLAKVMVAGPHGAIVIVGKNRDAIYRNVFEPIETIATFAMFAPHVIYRQGSPTARIFGKVVHVIGANDAKAENKIRGMTVQLAFLDEVTILHVDFFKQLLGRMSVPGAQMFGTTNPDSPAHWLKTEYLDRIGVPVDDGEDALPDWRRFHFTIDDNPSLEESYKDSLRREYTGLWFRRFILGEWVAAEGAIWDMFDEDKHVIPYYAMPPLAELVAVGLDYGTTNPTHAILLGLTAEKTPRLIAVDEWRYVAKAAESRWTDSQLSEGLRGWLAKVNTEHGMLPRWVFVDPSAASFHTQLRTDRVQGLTPAENDVAYGLRTVANLFAQNQLLVTDRCAGLITEIPGYSWDPKATEKGEDKPIKVADHGCDGLRYAVTTSERHWHHYLNPA